MADTLTIAWPILKWLLIAIVALFALAQLVILIGLVWSIVVGRPRDEPDLTSPPP